MVAVAPVPRLPAPRHAALSVTATGGPGLRIRVVVLPHGRRAVPGPWGRPTHRLAMPRRVARALAAGSLPGYVEARDHTGAVVRSHTMLLPPTPGPGSVRVVRHGSRHRAQVALVFDDGLDEGGVVRIVSALRKANAGGSLCLNGINVQRWSPATVATLHDAVMDGVITMCSHGWGHRTNTHTGVGAARADLAANASTDRKLGLWSIPFYRPPYGLYGPGITRAAGSLGYRWLVMWDVDPSDYLKPGKAVLARRVVRDARRGSIVVMHGIGSTADAVPAMVRGLRRKGLRPVTLTTMFMPRSG